jgi:hypothetical protein
MEGIRKGRDCKLKRCYECNRFEEEVWNLAYEQVWPLVRRALERRQSEEKCASQAKTTAIAKGGQRHAREAERRDLCARQFAAAG